MFNMNFKEYVNKYLGKAVDYDGTSNVQCVDNAKLYLDKVYTIKCGKMGNAKDWWLKRNSNKIIKDNFDAIVIDSTKPYALTKLKEGDIGIRTSGTYGHIFIVESVSKTNITYYDFNGTGHNDVLTKRIKPYTTNYITGVLRKKTTSKTVKASGGLHYYKTLKGDKAGTIPNGTKVQMIVKDCETKTIDKKSYKMSLIWYKNEMVYVANTYLK